MDSPGSILRRHRLTPKHSWGQNFLSDEQVLSDITKAAGLGAGQTVIELGAGLGHLTGALLETGAKVFAVERDRDLVKVLRGIDAAGLTVVEANAATLDFAGCAQSQTLTVVGNLPYHLTSPILFRVLEQRRVISRAVFTVQKEVAVRLSAKPGGRDYGLLTVLLGLFFDIETLFDLPRDLFHPPPKVDSSVIRLQKRGQSVVDVGDNGHFVRVVKAAFAHRRKTLLNSLKSDSRLGTAQDVAGALERCNIAATRRAETLSVEEFGRLALALSPSDGGV